MSNFLTFNTNFITATLRSITHEIDRVNTCLNNPDLDDDLSEELGEYVQDLSGALSLLAEEYENRRKSEPDNGMPEIASLLKHFSAEALF